MLLPLVVVLGLLLVSGAALTGVLLMSRAARREMTRRVNLVLVEGKVLVRGPAGALQVASRRAGETLRGLFSVAMPYLWGTHSTGIVLLAMGTVAGIVMWLLALKMLHFSHWAALLVAAATFFLVPRFRLRMEQRRSELQFMDLFPDTIDMVVRMLRAGMPVTAAIRSVGREAPSPVREVFAELADQVEIGIPFEDALNLAGEKIGLGDFRFFSVAVSLQRTSGGNLVTTLETMSDIIRKRRATRLKAKSATAEVRMSTYILAAIPFLVIGGLAVLSPAYLSPLVNDPRGNVILGAAIGMLGLGFLTMRQMMRSATRV